MTKFKLMSPDTFRQARLFFSFLEKICKDNSIKYKTIKRADRFNLIFENYQTDFEIAPYINNRILELENAIRKHRDQKLDDRCFLDDQELYKVLNEPIPEDYNAIPPIDKMLKNCKRYLEKRCNPDNKWKSYQELEEELSKLKDSIKEQREINKYEK